MKRVIVPLLFERLREHDLLKTMTRFLGEESYSIGMILDWLKRDHPHVLEGLGTIKRDTLNAYCKRHGMSVNQKKYNSKPNEWKMQYRYRPEQIKEMHRLGQKAGLKSRKKNGCTNPPQTLDYWLGVSNGNRELAEEKRRIFTRQNSPRCIEFWLKKGLTLDLAKERIREQALNAAIASLKKTAKPKTEFLVAEALKDHEILYVAQYVLCDSSVTTNQQRFVFDFYIPIKNLLIEVNGTYWHCDPVVFKEDDVVNFPGNRKFFARDLWKRDAVKTNVALKQGYKTVTLWEKDLNKWTPKEILAALNL